MLRNFLLQALLTATAISVFMTPFAAHFSDSFGRKRIHLLGAVRVPSLVFLAVALSLVALAVMYGPQAALIAESFGARVRYSGASLGYRLSSIIAGGPAPLIATWLLARYHSGAPIAVFILICAVISLVSTAMPRDYTNRDPGD
jgi:MFS family permease